MRKVMPYVGLGMAALTGVFAMVMQMRIDPVNVISSDNSTPTVTITNTLPPCAFDEFDSSIPNCVYDARVRGDKRGTPFIIYNGESYSLQK